MHPIFLIANENDTAAPIDVISPQFSRRTPTAPSCSASCWEQDTWRPSAIGGRHRGYTTAWLAYHLLGEQVAYRVFYGDEKCTLCIDTAWKTQRKNLP